MSARRLYLDDAPGERRGVVTLHGRPERLLLDRDGDAALQVGAQAAGRVRRIERGLGLAFLDLGDAGEAALSLPQGSIPVVEGELALVEVSAPARRGKSALLRRLGPADGAPGLRTPAPDLLARLRGFAPGEPVGSGRDARDAADEAEEAALAVEHALPGGGRLSLEPTRALVAVDIDVAASAGSAEARRAMARVNRTALDHAARLLRLKGLGGLIVVDLAGGGGDAAALAEHARCAFAPDMPGVVVGGVSRFGALELVLPWRSEPTVERLTDADGRLSALTVALRLARAIEREAAPGTRVLARCAPDVAAAFAALAPLVQARLGPRFEVEGDAALARARLDVKSC